MNNWSFARLTASLKLLPPPPSPVAPIKSRMETFWYRLTRLSWKMAVKRELLLGISKGSWAVKILFQKTSTKFTWETNAVELGNGCYNDCCLCIAGHGVQMAVTGPPPQSVVYAVPMNYSVPPSAVVQSAIPPSVIPPPSVPPAESATHLSYMTPAQSVSSAPAPASMVRPCWSLEFIESVVIVQI